MMDETIVAIATPTGQGAIGVVRLSGAKAHGMADAVFVARNGQKLADIRGYTARLGAVYDADGHRVDEVVALVYRAPKSYTGQDAVELMCHGGEVVCEQILRALLAEGAVLAGPGEFTRRALLNGRLTLTQAEAVCDLINAASRQGELAAASLQGGALYAKTQDLQARMMAIQAHITAAIDFPEEDVEEMDAGALNAELAALNSEFTRLVDSYEVGGAVLRGVPTVIAGSPNVGKSTLLNLLAGAQKAIVTDMPGTTRDVLEQQVRLGGTTLLLADTAGIRQSDDVVETAGIERAISRTGQASLVLAVFDASRPLDADDRQVLSLVEGKRVVAVVNKTDLTQRLNSAELEALFEDVVYISANDPAALGVLDAAVARAVRLENLDPGQPILANERQRSCALRAQEAVGQAAVAAWESTLDVVYALLSEALAATAELSGENVSEAVLDEVFARFCVGK
jgi:tRNA modification GTPase